MGALDDFAKYSIKLTAAISNSLEREVFDIIRAEMKEQIQQQVYDKLPGSTPKEYIRRRENGGLLDDRNIAYHMESPTSILVRNFTLDTGHMGYIDGMSITENAFYGDVVEAVESGEGYTWRSDIPPRPFHQPTEEAVVSKGLAKQALLQGLKRQGFIK